uniref:Uncharacterized protein n=1 Tax=Lepeophtheirus salmonis TaxID=72036 RepID=A0A0K2ULZ4_LEPSM
MEVRKTNLLLGEFYDRIKQIVTPIKNFMEKKKYQDKRKKENNNSSQKV